MTTFVVAGGRVGIGTTTPVAMLDVGGQIIGRNSSVGLMILGSANGATMVIDDTGNNANGRKWEIGESQAFGTFSIVDTTGSNPILNLKSGNVGIGTISPGAKLHVSGGNIKIDGGNALHSASGNIVIGGGANGSSSEGIFFMSNDFGATLGTIYGNGVLSMSSSTAIKPGGGSWSAPSDLKLKDQVRPFTDGLDMVIKINPVKFKYNGRAGLPPGQEFVGVIADEMQKIIPYTVHSWKAKMDPKKDKVESNLLAFDPGPLVYILINAVKEQQKEIEALKVRIKALEAP